MPRPLLAVDNLTWRPPDEPALFEDVSLKLRPGERLVVQGPSGAGKSTLLRCLVGLEPRESGVLRWRDRPVEPEEMRRFRRHVVYLHQQPVAIAPTVADNLEFARQMAESLTDDRDEPPADADRQRGWLDELGLDGIELDRRFEGLSVGEQQRVSLVRTLTLRPDVLLLDEPTAALDEERAHQLEDRLVDYVESQPDRRALVWVSHSSAQIDRIATRTLDIESL